MYTPAIEKTPYGFLVSMLMPGSEDHRFSFVKKDGTDAYEIGNAAGPLTQNPHKRWRLEMEAKLALSRHGHMVVI